MKQKQSSPPVRLAPGLREFTLSNGSKAYRADVWVEEEDGRKRQRQVTLQASTRTEAKRAHAALIAKQTTGQAIAPSRRTVAQAVEECLASMEARVAAGDLAPRTLETYRWRLRLRVLPELGSMQLQRLSADDIARCVSKWQARGDKAWTIRGVLNSLGRVLRFSVRRGWISDSPLGKLEPGETPRIERTQKKVLGLEEISKLVDAATDGSRALVATLALSGLRKSECLGLAWEDVDFEAGLLRVREQLSLEGDRVKLKTEAATRDVILHPGLAGILKRHKAEAFSRGHARPDSFVFATSSGRAWSQRNTSRSLKLAAAKAGIGHVHSHQLRHSFVSWLILELGMDVVRVAEQVGHSRPSITLDVYSHLFQAANYHAELTAKIAASPFGQLFQEGASS
jgi:integrase